MSKVFFSQHSLKLLFTVMLGCFCFFPSGNAFAGRMPAPAFDQPVTGTVKDGANGNMLQGATISIKGTGKSTTTDAKGSFSISVPGSNSVLVISYVGYETQELTVGSNTNLNVTLSPGSAELNQVVVVGYGTQRKKDVTGAVKTVKSEAFNKGIINSPQQLLQGKVSGVNVTSVSGEPGSIQGITIRGPGGVRTGNTPLFVVDGLPLDNAATSGVGDPLNFINSADIESIDVLKDASGTAIYGSRGANGVIFITTKKGKAGVASVNFSTSTGFSSIARKLPVLSAAQFRAEVPKLGGTLDDGGTSTDWQDQVTRNAISQNYNLAMSGGADKLTYYASFGMQKQEGILKANSLDRYTGRINVTQKVWEDRLIIDANLSYGVTNNKRPPISGLIGDAITNNPTYAATDATGKFIGYTAFNNPLLNIDLDKEITDVNRLVGSITSTLRLTKGLNYKFNFGIDNSTSTRDVEALPSLVPVRIGRLDNYYGINRNTLVENYLTYNWSKNKHNFSALAGHSWQEVFIQTRNSSISNFPISQIDPIYNPGTGTQLTLADNRPGGSAIVNELQSFFGRINYQYANKYMLTVNFRADGSTKFGGNNKYGYFPSFSAGWKISDEDFMKNSFFSNLKLRAGYGVTGNQEIKPKATQPLFTVATSSGGYPLFASGAYPSGITYVRFANPDLQWETSKQTDLGLDFGLFKGALTGTIDVFQKVSSNILLEVIPFDPVSPVASTYKNVKDMKITNKGIELELDYNHKSASGISYNIGGNVTYLKNDVQGSPYTILASGSASGSGLTGATINGYLNGQPIGTFFLKEFTGFNASGISTFRDLDGDNVITDKDRVALGTALPNVIYAFYGGLGYKGFDFNINFNGVSGNKIYDNTANSNNYKLKLSKNVNVTPEAIAVANESVNNSAPVSSRYLYDGAYLRLNNLALGYTFNTSKMGSFGKFVTGMRLSVTGQNLFVSTKYKGFDPEVNTDRQIGEVTSYGIDYLSYPKARTFIIGLNISF